MSSQGPKSESIDLKTLVKKLPPDQIGQFEPVSGVMVLNIDFQNYRASAQRWADKQTTPADRMLINTINHETYHFVQTSLTGYMFKRAKMLFNTLNQDDNSIVRALDKAEEQANEVLELALKEAGDDPSLIKRANDIASITYYHKRTAILHANCPENDHSLAGALMPHFFQYRDDLLQKENELDAHGLSILGVIEGAAVAYAAHLAYDEHSVEQRIEAELVKLPSLYAQSWQILKQQTPQFASELILPISAIALCYQKPNTAFHFILAHFLKSEPTNITSYTEQLFCDLPYIEDAGEILKTARHVRVEDDSYILYDSVLKAWKCEQDDKLAFALLSDPLALNRMDHIPICSTLSDNLMFGQVPAQEAQAKIYIASLILKVTSRRREEKDFQKFAMQWGRNVINRFTSK